MKKNYVSIFGIFTVVLAVSVFSSAARADSLGHHPFGLRFDAGVSRTDNRDKIDSKVRAGDKEVEEEDDTRFSLSARISYNPESWGRYSLKLAYQPFYTYYDNPRPNSERWEVSHNFIGKFVYFLGERAIFSIDDSYWWSGNSDWYYGDDYTYLKDVDDSWTEHSDDYYVNRLGGSIMCNLSELNYLTLEGAWRVKRYDDSVVARTNDEDELNARATFMHRLSRFFQAGVYADYTRYDHDSIDNIDLGVDYVTVGLQILYDIYGDEALVFKASSGYNTMFYEDDELDDKDMVGDSSLELLITPHERIRGKVGVRRGNVYSSSYPFTSEDSTAIYGSCRYIFGSNNMFALGAEIEYRMRDYEMDDLDKDAMSDTGYSRRMDAIREKSGDVDRDSLWFRLRFDWNVTSDITASAFYSRESIDSEFCTEYDENVFGVRMSYKFM